MSQGLVRYEDFVIRFGQGPGGVYTVDVDSPAGEARGTFEIPESLRVLKDQEPIPPGDGETRDAIPRAGKTDRSVREVGSDLFYALFQGSVLRRFENSLGRRLKKGYGLRISIELDPAQPGLARLLDLPWESLCDPDRGFLALNEKTPIVRTLRVPEERKPAFSPQDSLRILAVSASPRDHTPLNVDHERKNLENAVQNLKDVTLEIHEQIQREEVADKVRELPFNVFHFMGHGGFDKASGQGSLVFEKPDRLADSVSAEALARDLNDSDVQLYFLNACHTAVMAADEKANPFAGAAASLVKGGAPAVIAMSRAFSDRAAVAFSRRFYKRLAAGDPVEAAVTLARQAIEEMNEWTTPVLFLRASKEPEPNVRRISFLSAALVALTISLFLALGWFRDFRAGEARRLNNEAVALLKNGQEERAREVLHAVFKIDPDNAMAHSNLSVLEARAGNREEALEHARAAVEAEPNVALYHYNLGTFWAEGGNDEARRSFEEALRLEPDYAEARNELGNLYLELDRPAEARREFKAGLQADPELASLHKNLARVDLREGRIDKATSGLETALGLYDPGNRQGIAETLYLLAKAHAQAGHKDEACGYLEEVRHEAGAGHWVSEAERLAQQIPCPAGLLRTEISRP